MGKLLLFLGALMWGMDQVHAFGGVTTGYSKGQDSEGHTVYTRKRLVRRDDHSSSSRRSHFDDDDDSDSDGNSPILSSLIQIAAAVAQVSSSSSSGETPKSYLTADTQLETQTQPVTRYWEEPKDPSWAISLGLGAGGNNMSHFDLSADWISDYLDATLGLSIMNSDKSYSGFIGGVRAHLPWKVSPFVGVGFFSGDSSTCTTTPVDEKYDEETCEMYVMHSLTYEGGLQARLSDHFQVRAFARHFMNARQDDIHGDTLYGFNLMLLF